MCKSDYENCFSVHVPCRFVATKKWTKSQRHKIFIWDLKKWLLVLMFDARWWIVKCSWVVGFHLECLLPECSLKSRGVCEQPFEQTPAARCHFAQSKHKRIVSLNQRKQLGPTALLRVFIACFGFLWPLSNEAMIYCRYAHRITENSCINTCRTWSFDRNVSIQNKIKVGISTAHTVAELVLNLEHPCKRITSSSVYSLFFCC